MALPLRITVDRELNMPASNRLTVVGEALLIIVGGTAAAWTIYTGVMAVVWLCVVGSI